LEVEGKLANVEGKLSWIDKWFVGQPSNLGNVVEKHTIQTLQIHRGWQDAVYKVEGYNQALKKC